MYLSFRNCAKKVRLKPFLVTDALDLWCESWSGCSVDASSCIRWCRLWLEVNVLLHFLWWSLPRSSSDKSFPVLGKKKDALNRASYGLLLIWKQRFLTSFPQKTATPGLPAGDGFELLRRRSSHLVSVALKCLKSISAAEQQSDGSKNNLLFQDWSVSFMWSQLLIVAAALRAGSADCDAAGTSEPALIEPKKSMRHRRVIWMPIFVFSQSSTFFLLQPRRQASVSRRIQSGFSSPRRLMCPQRAPAGLLSSLTADGSQTPPGSWAGPSIAPRSTRRPSPFGRLPSSGQAVGGTASPWIRSQPTRDIPTTLDAPGDHTDTGRLMFF